MKHLPLYEDNRAVVETAEALTSVNRNCKRCKLGEKARTVCLGADGQNPDPVTGFEGTLLVIGDHPSGAEDASGRPLSHGANSNLRALIEEHHNGPVVYATALRCAPGKKKPTKAMIRDCRPYTTGLIRELKPSRIICLGKHAYWTVLGAACDSIQLGRRGYGYLADETPVFMLHAANRVVRNRFLYARWKKDLIWALGAEPELPPWDGVIKEVENHADAVAACADLARTNRFAFDTETGGLMGAEYFQVVCLTATPAHDLKTVYLWTEEALKDPACLAPLQDLLRDETVLKVGHNLKYDFEAVAYGLDLIGPGGVLEVRGVGGDTNLWLKALDTESMSRLDHADNHVGMGGHKDQNKAALDAALELIGRARADKEQRRLPGHTHPALRAAVAHPDVDGKSFAYALVPRKVLYRYCALDTVATARLDAKYRPIVMSSPPRKLLHDMLQCPPTSAIAQVEAWGMSADVAAVHRFGKLLKPRREQYVRQIRAQGCDVDINSSDQLREYLYDTLGLPVTKLTKKSQAPSTDAETLKKLKDHHPVIPLLLEYATVDKLISTYVDGLLPHIRPDGRIRSSLNIAGARSGRMSSSNPNLQNIPSSGVYAKMAKTIFNAPPGHVLLQLDYSQLEVRIAAMLSGDKNLTQAYLDGVDVHRRTASKAFHIPEQDISKEQRRRAKAVVFGVLYGKSPNSLAKDLSITGHEGQALYDSVLGGLPDLNQWMRDQRSYVQRHGASWTYVPMPDGSMHRARNRQLWQIASPDSGAQSTARNGAVNTPVQGSASDYMLRSVVAAVEWIVGDGIPCRVTNTVHDSIILEVPFEWALEVADMIKGIMEAWPSCGVPLVADLDVGMTWGSLHTMKGITLVMHGKKNNLTDAEILHVAKADSDLADEMGDDPAGWLKQVEKLGSLIGA